MLNYFLISGDPESVSRIFDRTTKVFQSVITFEGGDFQSRIAQNRSWAFCAQSVPDDVLENRIVTSNRGIFMINGPILRMRGASGPISESALEVLGNTGSADDLFERFDGAYNCASVTSRNGLVAFGDFSGAYPVYVKEGAGYVAVSNRASVLAAIDGTLTYDLQALSWLVGHANVFGTSTPFADVRLILPGTFACSKPLGSQLHIRQFKRQIWPVEEPVSARPNLSSLDWDEVTHELVENVRAIGRMSDGIKLSLTGGKDSRLMLALAKSAGVADKVQAFTNGPEGSPEIACAEIVAKTAAVPHKANTRTATVVKHDMQRIWRRLRQHAFRYDAMVCPWDGSNDPLQGTTLELTGFGGELYRGPGGHAKQFKKLTFVDASESDLIKLWHNYHQPMDPLQCLRPAMDSFQRDWIASWVRGRVDSRRDVLPERFYVENRLANWNGPLAQNTLGRIKLMPLLSPIAARKVFELAPGARNAERLHYEVMVRTAPELVGLPFLKATWAPEIISSADLELAQEEFKSSVPVTSQAITSWQWEFFATQKKEIENLLLEAASSTEIGEVFSTHRVIETLRSPDDKKQVIQLKNVFSAIGIAHTLLGRSEAVRDRPLN